jgi:two-component system OmpR family response regulator
MRLLLVEDDPVLGAQLHKLLGKAGYAADWVQDGVDLGLPGKSGLEVLKNWRTDHLKLPVIVLTARGTWQEKVEGFNAGADDYVPKPFQPEELLARIGAVLKRAVGNAPESLKAKGLLLDETLQTVQVNDDSPQQLTATEFRLLRYFMLHPGQPLSKTRLTDHVYEYDTDKDSNVMEVYVNRLRKKIGPQWIQTRKGQGYVFGESIE